MQVELLWIVGELLFEFGKLEEVNFDGVCEFLVVLLRRG